MSPCTTSRHVPRVLLRAAVLALTMAMTTACPRAARAEGIIEGITGYSETTYTLFSSKSTDSTGTTFKSQISNYGTTFNLGVNYDLLPTLNLNSGLTWFGNLAVPSGDLPTENTTTTRFQPFVWLTLHDDLWQGQLGYSLQEASVKTSRLPKQTLSQETYTAYLNWRPTDLPMTQLRYTHTISQDEPRQFLDTTQDFIYLKSEYIAGGLDTYYVGTYLRTDNKILDVVSTLFSNEGRLTYSTSLFDERVSVITDNRVRYTEIENVTQLPLPFATGLSALSDTPQNVTLAANPALTDGDKTTSSGINIGYPGPGGNFTRRNVGLDFITPGTVSQLQVWVDGWGPSTLPADITNSFSWEVYTSADNQTWTFHTIVTAAAFGPFDRRFEISFPAVTTRYVKVVTRPLSGGVIGTTDSSLYPNIFITELQAFVDQTAPEIRQRITQLAQNYNLDVKVILFRSPSLYYRLYAQYLTFESGGQTTLGQQTRYYVSNGLYYTQPLTPILTASANAQFEVGTEAEQLRTGTLYYGSLAATPLPTLTDSLVASGNQQWVGKTSMSTNTVGIYNTAQLYRGIDAMLNLGVAFTSNDDGVTTPLHRRDVLINVGTGVTPNPALTLSAYYTGKLSHATGGPQGGASDTNQNTLDLAMSFTPLPAFSISAGANIFAVTGAPTEVRYNGALNWTPFPDGQLQFTLTYSQSHLPENSTILQPTIRWYLSPRRRSYFEASYQYNTVDFSTLRSSTLKTQSNIISATLKVYF
jgi:hypothetical protein